MMKIYRTVILPVLDGCEAWSVTFREECRLRVFENRVVRKIFTLFPLCISKYITNINHQQIHYN
jgi:hypothetical protein